MPRKGMRSIFFHPSPPHTLSSSPSPSTLAIDTFRATLMEDNIASAEKLITKWDPEGSSFAKITSLFYESPAEARRFLLAAQDLHQAMLFFSKSTSIPSSHHYLVRGQRLMLTAMARLQKELYQILAANRDRLDSDSVRSSARSSLSTASFSDFDDDYRSEVDDIVAAGERIQQVEKPPTAVMIDLRSIVQCMVSCGYARECVGIYKSIRRSIVDEGLFKLGFERLKPSQFQKLDWDSLDRRITNWLAASGVAIRTLFSGERVLCDFVFESSAAIKESCFAEIVRDAAVQFLGFPELATLTKGGRSPEKIFRYLEMYNAMVELLPEVGGVFSYESTAAVSLQVQFTQMKLGECIRASLADFETALHKESSKEVVPGGGVHPLTQHAMEYMVHLADYGRVLAEIYADCPVPAPRSPLPEPFHSFIYPSSVPSSPCAAVDEDIPPAISARMSWLLLILLCKLDCKADFYRDPSLAYLFLANNLHYVLTRVQRSNLRWLLGREWVSKHEKKVRSFWRSYESLGWSKVLESIPKDPATMLETEGGVAARESMREFNRKFEETYKKHASWVVTDGKMREEIRGSVSTKVVEAYRSFYEECRGVLRADKDAIGVVRFAPEDVGSYLLDLFKEGSTSPSPSSGSLSCGSPGSNSWSGSSSSKGSRWRRLTLLRLRGRGGGR